MGIPGGTAFMHYLGPPQAGNSANAVVDILGTATCHGSNDAYTVEIDTLHAAAHGGDGAYTV